MSVNSNLCQTGKTIAIITAGKVQIFHDTTNHGSGAGTNLKVGGGTHVRCKVPEKKISVVPLHFFGCTSTISRFGERFRDGQYSLVSFLFAVLLRTVPPPVPSHF